MVDAVYVIDKASGIPLYHKSFFSDNSIEEMLLSGFITAMTNFGNDIHIGNISSFDTEKNRCVMVSSDKRLLAVLYDPTKEGGLDVHSLAGYLIDEFEKKYPSQTEPMGVERTVRLDLERPKNFLMFARHLVVVVQMMLFPPIFHP